MGEHDITIDDEDARAPMRLEPPDIRPDILVTPDAHETVDAMIHALRVDPDLYQRDRALVHVTATDGDEHHPAGAPCINEAQVEWLVDRVSRYGRCVTVRQGKKGTFHKPVAPPPARVRGVMARCYWPQLRVLEGVIETPALRPDGSVLQEPGYDVATRSLYAPSASFPPVPSKPTHSDAVVAYARLADVFRDFPFVAESHRAAVIAAVLTLLARPAIEGAIPAWLFDASSPRSGKSLQMDVISIIATGRRASRMTYPETDEELEKVLVGYALNGARIVPFDNVARPFGGAALDKCITATDTVDLRILGSPELRTLVWRALVMASGNNLECRGDMLPRVLAPRLESPLENPELRDLRDLREHVAAHRVGLVRDALTLLRAYVHAGAPTQEVQKWGGFEAWVSLVPSALVWVGAPDPMGARRGGTTDEDPTRTARRVIVMEWERLCKSASKPALTASEAIARLYPPPRPDEPPDGMEDMREAVEQLTNARPGSAPGSKRLAGELRKLKAAVVAGSRMVSESAGGGIARWRTVKA